MERPKQFEISEQHLEYVLKRAYRYAFGDMNIGSEEMQDDLCDALCNLIGDDAFVEWNEAQKC